jgi:NADH:ubiquinone oxidoreductase subunit E
LKKIVKKTRIHSINKKENEFFSMCAVFCIENCENLRVM